MFSRRGISTIQSHMCFSQNQYDAPPVGVLPKNKTPINPERMTRGISRDDFKRLQMADEKGYDDSDGEGVGPDMDAVVVQSPKGKQKGGEADASTAANSLNSVVGAQKGMSKD